MPASLSLTRKKNLTLQQNTAVSLARKKATISKKTPLGQTLFAMQEPNLYISKMVHVHASLITPN